MGGNFISVTKHNYRYILLLRDTISELDRIRERGDRERREHFHAPVRINFVGEMECTNIVPIQSHPILLSTFLLCHCYFLFRRYVVVAIVDVFILLFAVPM